MLQTKNLSYAYKGQVQMDFPDLNCAKGTHWLLLGQSGSGKTTFLHLLGGLLTPSQGSIQLDETALHQLSGSALDRFRGQQIGIIFQKAHFVNALNVGENLLLAQQLAGQKPSTQDVKSLLANLAIDDKVNKKINQLSMGEQQRVAIARALIKRPSLILADEPTSALDDENSQRVIQLLETQALAVNATLLIVTHDQRLKDHFDNKIILESLKQTL